MGPLGAGRGRNFHQADVSPVNVVGSEAFYWPTEIERSGSTVLSWPNLGTAGADLDLDADAGAVIFADDRLDFDGSSGLSTAGNASLLAMADGDDLDVVLVCQPESGSQLMAAFGASTDCFRVSPRTGGGTQFLLLDAGATFVRELGPNMSVSTLYCVRGHIAGAASPSNDVATIRANDTTYDPGDANDVGAVAWATPLLMGIISGTAFSGYVHAAAAKIGGYSAEELAILTEQINDLTGLGLTSV